MQDQTTQAQSTRPPHPTSMAWNRRPVCVECAAIKSVTHKLARAGYHLIKDGGHFDVKRAFG